MSGVCLRATESRSDVTASTVLQAIWKPNIHSLYSANILHFYISFKLNFVSTTNFFRYVIIFRISKKYRIYWHGFFSCVMLHIVLVMSWMSVIALTSSCVWSIVYVGTVMMWFWGCWSSFQLVCTCIEQRYCALKTNFPSSYNLSVNLWYYPVVYMILMWTW